MITWRDYQCESMEAVFNSWKTYKHILGVAATGAGKAQPLDAKVLTPFGWTTMGRIQVNSLVIGGDGQAHRVSGVFPQGVKDVYRITFSDGTSTECCADHLWNVQTRSQKHRRQGFKVMALKEIMAAGLTEAGGAKWFIPVTKPVDFFGIADLPIDPYVLGCLLGDGQLGKNGTLYTTRISSADQFIVNEVGDRLSGVATLKHLSNYDYAVQSRPAIGHKSVITSLLDDLGLMGKHSWEKFIPRDYLYSSIDNRIALLRGLMDTDGTIETHSGRAPEFCTTSKQLAEDVCELVRSLGGVTRIRYKAINAYTYGGERKVGRPCYRITVSISDNPFLLPRKADHHNLSPNQGRTKAIVKIDLVGQKECRCIMVDSRDHTYVTDDYIVTHNTNIIWGVVERFLIDNPKARVMLVAHREELIAQPETRVKEFFPGLRSKIGVVMGSRNEPHKQIIIGTIQTVGGRSGKRLSNVTCFGKIDLLIIDEAHHAEAPQYFNLFNALKAINPDLQTFGVTATPERGDKKLLTRIFQKEAFNIGVRRLIDEGHLCEPIFHGIKTKVDLSDVGVNGTGGKRDYVAGKLVSAFETKDVFDLVVRTHLENCGHRPSVIFTVSVDGAKRLTKKLCDAGIKAVAIYSQVKQKGKKKPSYKSLFEDDPDFKDSDEEVTAYDPDMPEDDGKDPKTRRREAIEGMHSGRYTCLVNVMIATEGFDFPKLECLHIVRPTKSDALWIQMVGRVLRLSPGKTHADVFDYLPLDDRNFEQRMQMYKPPKKHRASPEEPITRGAGKVKPRSTGEMEIVLLDYFGRKQDAWLESIDGWRCIQLGKGYDHKKKRTVDRGLALSPDGQELWAIWRTCGDQVLGIRGDRWAKARVIATGDVDKNLAMIDDYTQRYGDKIIMSRSAAWRNKAPSNGMIQWGKREDVYKEGMSQGELSDAINHKLIMDAVYRGIKHATAQEAQEMEF